MKTKHYLIAAILTVAVTGFILSGCSKKADTTAVDNDTVAAQDEANASFVMQDAKIICDGAVQNIPQERVANNNFPPCATFIRYDSTWVLHAGDTVHDTIMNIFFTGNCESIDNRTRKGEITVLWDTIPYFDSAATITITFNNYSVKLLNGFTISVAGSCVVVNNGSTKKFYYGDISNTLTANLTLTYLAGSQKYDNVAWTWNANRTNILTSQGIYGYFYEVTGSASGTTSNGESYTSTIAAPLYHTAYWINTKKLYPVCPCYEQGQVSISRSGKSATLLLNYTAELGHASCTANGTISGNIFNFTLP